MFAGKYNMVSLRLSLAEIELLVVKRITVIYLHGIGWVPFDTKKKKKNTIDIRKCRARSGCTLQSIEFLCGGLS